MGDPLVFASIMRVENVFLKLKQRRQFALCRSEMVHLVSYQISQELITGRARLIRSHSSARFCFELSGNLN